MTATTVTLTGTGVPLPVPGRAGAGCLVRYGGIALQFDAGRGTVLRLVEAMQPPDGVTALFLTHSHIDHVSDVADLAMTRWIFQAFAPAPPLPIIAPNGSTADFVTRMFDPYEADITARTSEVLSGRPTVDLRPFAPTATPTEVWRSDDGEVVVEAVRVHHEPCDDAVAYRITTPDATVVVSGDTRVCDEVESLSAGADIVVHEACRSHVLRAAFADADYARVLAYHADVVELGAMAKRASVRHLVLTHLIPPPLTVDDEAGFARDVRTGGYEGELTVGTDLVTISAGVAAKTSA